MHDVDDDARGPQSARATDPCRPSGGLGAMLRMWHGPGPGRRPPCPASGLEFYCVCPGPWPSFPLHLEQSRCVGELSCSGHAARELGPPGGPHLTRRRWGLSAPASMRRLRRPSVLDVLTSALRQGEPPPPVPSTHTITTHTRTHTRPSPVPPPFSSRLRQNAQRDGSAQYLPRQLCHTAAARRPGVVVLFVTRAAGHA